MVYVESLIMPGPNDTNADLIPYEWETQAYREIKEVTRDWIKRMRERELETAVPVSNAEMKDIPGYRYYKHGSSFNWVYEQRKSLWGCAEEIYAVGHYFSSQGLRLEQYHGHIEAVCYLLCAQVVQSNKRIDGRTSSSDNLSSPEHVIGCRRRIRISTAIFPHRGCAYGQEIVHTIRNGSLFFSPLPLHWFSTISWSRAIKTT